MHFKCGRGNRPSLSSVRSMSYLLSKLYSLLGLHCHTHKHHTAYDRGRMPIDMETIPPQPTLHHEGAGGDLMRPSGTTMGGTGVGVMARHSTINHCESHSLNKCEMRVPHNS